MQRSAMVRTLKVLNFVTPIFELINHHETQFFKKIFLLSDFFHFDVTNWSEQLTANQ
jgi:hypothetical protein